MPDVREQIKRIDTLDQKEDKKVSLIAGRENELTETYITKTEELLSKADELDNNDPGKQKVKDGTAQLLGEIDEKTLAEKQSEFDKQINGFIDGVEGEKSEEEKFKRIEPGIEDALASAGVRVDMSKFRDYYRELNELERAPITELEDDMIDFAAQLKAYEDMSRFISEEEINKIFNLYIRGEVEIAANERQKVEEVLKLDEYKKTLEKAEAEDMEATEKLLSATREDADGLALDAVKTKLEITETLRPFVKLRKLADEGVSDGIFDEIKGFSFSALSSKQDGSLEVVREFSEFPKTESELEAMKTGFKQDLKKAGEIAFIKTGKEEFRAYARAVMAERIVEAEKTNNEKLIKYAKDLNRITKTEQFSSKFNVAKRLAEELDVEVKSDSGENKEYLSKIKEYRAEAYRFLNTILQGDQVLDFQKESMGFVQDTKLFMENSGKMIGEIQEKGEVPSEYFWQNVREYSKETVKKINGLAPIIQRFKDLAPLEGDSDEVNAINKKIEELKKLRDEIGKYAGEVRQICQIQIEIEGSGMGLSGFLNVAGILVTKITIAVAVAVAIGAAIAATGGVAAFGLTGFTAVAGNFFLSNVLIAVGTTTASHLTDFAFEGANASQGIWEDTKNFGSSTLTSLAFSAGGGAIGNVAGKAIGRGYGELLKRIPEKAAMQADKIVSGLLGSAQEGFKEGGKQAFGTIWGRALHGIKEIGKETTEEIMEESLDAIGKGLVAQNDDTSQWVGFMFQLIPQIVSGGKSGIESVRVEGKIGNVSIKTSEIGMNLEYSSEKDLVNFCEGRAVPAELLKRVRAGETTFTIEKNGVTIEIKKIGGQTIGGKEISKYESIVTDSDGKIIGYDGNKPPQELADAAIAEGKQVYYNDETGDLHIGETKIRRIETDTEANAPMPNEISLGRRAKEGPKVLNEEVTRGVTTTAGFLGSGGIEGFFRGLYKGVRVAIGVEKRTSETVNELTQKPDFKPEDAINEFKKDPEIAKLFDQDVGVSEGYTLGQHTLMVMNQYQKYYGQEKGLPGGVSNGFFITLLALHDIGKPEAVVRGDKSLQHEITQGILGKKLKGLGYSEREIKIAKALISKDVIGPYTRGRKDINETAKDIQAMAADTGMDQDEFMELLGILYKVDAGSYTSDAGGEASLDALFNFDESNKENGLLLSGEYNDKMENLRSMIALNSPRKNIIFAFNRHGGSRLFNKETLSAHREKIRQEMDPIFKEEPLLGKFMTEEGYTIEKFYAEISGTERGKKMITETHAGEMTPIRKFTLKISSISMKIEYAKYDTNVNTQEELENIKKLAEEIDAFMEEESKIADDIHSGTSSNVLAPILEADGYILSSQEQYKRGIARVEGEGSLKGGNQFSPYVWVATDTGGFGVGLSYAEVTNSRGVSTNNMSRMEIERTLEQVYKARRSIRLVGRRPPSPPKSANESYHTEEGRIQFAEERLAEIELKLVIALRNRDAGITEDSFPVLFGMNNKGLTVETNQTRTIGALANEGTIEGKINLGQNLERMYVPQEYVEQTKQWAKEIERETGRKIRVYSIELAHVTMGGTKAESSYNETNRRVHESAARSANEYINQLLNNQI